MQLYIISGVTGMTGNELARKLIRKGNRVFLETQILIFMSMI